MKQLAVTHVQTLLAEATISDLPRLIRQFRSDTRPGVVVALRRAEARLVKTRSERGRLEMLADRERALAAQGITIVAGVDEVGRGALAGPVTAGACVLPLEARFDGLNDSKVLTRVARERLSLEIRDAAVAVAVAHASATEIDTIGIAGACVLAMRRALAALAVPVEHVLVDGRPVDVGFPSTAVVRGDATVRAIAAAAIVAKVERDLLMEELDGAYPGYGFAGNKGYGSADHLLALKERGPCAIHRMSFGPCCQPPLF